MAIFYFMSSFLSKKLQHDFQFVFFFVFTVQFLLDFTIFSFTFPQSFPLSVVILCKVLDFVFVMYLKQRIFGLTKLWSRGVENPCAFF